MAKGSSRRRHKKKCANSSCAGGAMSGTVGFFVGGPVGALVGGIVGSVTGEAASKATCPKKED